jgi:hypothetical protein
MLHHHESVSQKKERHFLYNFVIKMLSVEHFFGLTCFRKHHPYY